ncbi:hypothetical protein GCM10028784_00130 [Myceligenerans cantabricum]
MGGAMFDDGAGHARPCGVVPAGWDGGGFDDVEVVDELGLPVLPPEHTEEELAAILATNPYGVGTVGAAEAVGVARRPGGAVGAVVDLPRLLLEDAARLAGGASLAGALRDLTGFGRPDEVGVVDAHAVDGPQALDLLGEDELRRVVAGWERLVSWARAGQARAGAELMARTDGPLCRDSVAGEIAGELGVTTSEGWQVAVRGEGLSLYPDLAGALAAGRVDVRKADTFLRAGARLSVAERGAAISDLLPHAPARTWRWVSEQMNARAATLHGRKARQRDVVERCNVWAEQAGPAQGRIVADLPVLDTAKTFNAVQAAAKALKNVPGESRPLGALRAAAFTALVTGDLVLPGTDDDNEDDGDGVGVGVGVGAGSSVEPPRLVEPVLDTDLIPIPDAPSGTALTGPAPVLSPGNNTCSASDDGSSSGRDVPDAVAAAAGVRVRVIEVPATVHVTVPASVLLDPDDMTPGVLEGIGPIPADHAAHIAADATWRRLLTDPATGILTDYSTRTYTPAATLRAAVATRDQTCRFPGCHRPTHTGNRATVDLDHIDPYDKDHHYRPDEPGQTRADNLHALCRRHHNLKTHAHWKVTRDPRTGATRWTAPTGSTTTVAPTIVDPTVRYGLTHGLTLARPSSPADHHSRSATGPPPF